MEMEERVKALEDKVVDIRESVAWIQATLEQMAANLLVEQAEFELRCGLKAALRPTVASQSISARRLGIRGPELRTLRLSFIPVASPNRRRCSLQSQGSCFMTCRSVSRAGWRPCNTASTKSGATKAARITCTGDFFAVFHCAFGSSASNGSLVVCPRTLQQQDGCSS